MADIGKLLMKVEADTKDFDKGINKSKQLMGTLTKAVAVASVAMVGAFAAVSVKAIGLASDAQEMQNKFDVTFKTMSKDAESWAKAFSKATGRSINDTKKSISNIADLQQGLGMTEEASLTLAQKIVELGTDLASFNNLNDSDAIEAVSKAMLGEADSAKQLGLLLNVDRVNAYAKAQGYVVEELTAAERAQLTYELAVSQSQNAIGDAERSSGSFANQMKRLKSTLTDTSTEFGLKLLPVATKFLVWVNETLPRIQELKDSLEKALKPAFDVVKVAIKSSVDSLSTFWVFVKGNILPVIKDMANIVGENLPQIKYMFEETFNRIVEVLKIQWEFIRNNILPIYETLFNWVKDNMPQIRQTVEDAFDGILVAFDSVWKFTQEYILPIFEELVKLAIDIFPIIKSTAVVAFEGIVATAKVLWSFFKENLLPIFEALLVWVKDNMPAIRSLVQSAMELIKASVELVVAVFLNLLDGVKAIWEFFEPTFKDMGPLIGDAMTSIIGDVKLVIDTFTDLFNMVEKVIIALDKFYNFKSSSSNEVIKPEEGEKLPLPGGINSKGQPTVGSSGGSGGIADFANSVLDGLFGKKKTISGQNANGGPVSSGASYLVGEKGPEMFTPSSNGMITPNGGGSVVININGTEDPDLIMTRVVDYLSMQGITGR